MKDDLFGERHHMNTDWYHINLFHKTSGLSKSVLFCQSFPHPFTASYNVARLYAYLENPFPFTTFYKEIFSSFLAKILTIQGHQVLFAGVSLQTIPTFSTWFHVASKSRVGTV